VIVWSEEQLEAIERRRGDLLLAAGAGSGKTGVMVERFVRAVVEDGLRVDQILAITFTEKAAAELATRLRSRLRELGREDALDGAWVSTIHGFCARLLRTHPLQAGIDPRFAVLEETGADRLEDVAFTGAMDAWVEERGQPAIALAAAYGTMRLRTAIVAAHGERRSRGLPPELPPAPPPPDLEPLAAELRAAARELGAELRLVGSPSKKVLAALDALDLCSGALAETLRDVGALALPGGNGKALASPAAERYRAASAAYTEACVNRAAVPAWELLDALLRTHATRYAALKRARSALDFADLELGARDLLRDRPELRTRYSERFEALMVDEFQDTNPLQLELLDLIARGNLFTVGDELQSIYGFRHADVEGFRRRRAALAQRRATATLSANFRSRRAILDTVNLAFSGRFGEYTPLRPGRADAQDEPGAPPRVELLLTDRDADWSDAPLTDDAAPPASQLWRLAEARLLAQRVRELVDAGRSPGDIVVLLRATGDLAVFERALEDRGVRTYVVGGRGYWAQREVQDLLAHLAVLANPRDELRLYELLASPLVGVSGDGLVLIGAAARAASRNPWRVLREAFDPQEEDGQLSFDLGPEAAPLAALGGEDHARLAAFMPWLAAERAAAPRLPVATLLDRVLERTGSDEAMLRSPSGARRLANVRKLMRLARDHEANEGRDLRSFLDLVADRGGDGTGEGREAEAPVEGESLEAVRLMTIHRAKGLEFDVVCVADLGRGAPGGGDVIRLGADDRVGLRLATTDAQHDAFAYRELGDARRRAEAEEEQRLLYVALTRAREHLVVSGSVKLDPWPDPVPGREPIRWLAPALVPDIASLVAEAATGIAVRDEGDWHSEVAWAVNRPDTVGEVLRPMAATPHGVKSFFAAPPDSGAAIQDLTPSVGRAPAAISFTALEAHARCGYRYYVEQVLGLPPTREEATGGGAELGGAARGVLVHALLEDLDFAAPARPSPDAIDAAAREAGISLTDESARDIADLTGAFAESPLCARLAAAPSVAREERFAYVLGGTLLVGVLDVLARAGERALVVDYKTNRLVGRAPAAVVEDEYALQRLVYALALLRAGAQEVEVAYCFLERPQDSVAKQFKADQALELERELATRAAGLLGGEFRPSDHPHRELCLGCPARAGLCVHPRAVTGRAA